VKKAVEELKHPDKFGDQKILYKVAPQVPEKKEEV
jgi:hypothetical protein